MGNTKKNWCICAWTLNHSLTERTVLGHMPPMPFIQTCVFTVKIGKYLLDSLSKDDWVL